MPLLYYWRGDNYKRDLDHGVGFHLNQASSVLHEIAIGEPLWAFTRTGRGRYVLAAELVASAKTRNPPSYRYGPYRLWGDLRRSRYFAVDEQPDITTLIKSLSIPAAGDVLGRAFQGFAAVRRISSDDSKTLARYATRLPLEPRARLLPEERLEALLLAGDEEAVASLLQAEPAGIADARKRYLLASSTQRDRRLVEDLRSVYSGECQICSWSPRRVYGAELCEGHHVHWLSRGGPDDVSNMVLLCPNHHRAVHRCDAPFDYEANGFVFPGGHIEALSHIAHKLAA
jgi:hypothetical protein